MLLKKEAEKRLVDDLKTVGEESDTSPDVVNHIPSVSGYRKHQLPVSEGDDVDIAVLSNDNPEISRAHKYVAANLFLLYTRVVSAVWHSYEFVSWEQLKMSNMHAQF